MDYWICGDKEKAKQYSASFAALGFDVSHMCFEFNNWVYYTLDGIIHACCNDSLPKILEDHPRYQKLPLVDWEYSPIFLVGNLVVSDGLVGRVEEVRNETGVYEYKVGNRWIPGCQLRVATRHDVKRLLKND